MLPSRPPRYRLVPRLVALAVFIYAFYYISGFPREYDDEELPLRQQRHQQTSLTPEPARFDKIVVSIRTTTPDVYSKLPPLIVLTDARYYENLLFMSDLDTDIGGFHIIDVLDGFHDGLLNEHPDFERYRRQIDYVREGVPLHTIKEEDEAQEKEIVNNLDKYKWLRMLRKTWDVRPHREWYVFVDTETYLVRSTLALFLGQSDPETPFFFANAPVHGAPNPVGAGSHTVILSAGAMKQLLVERDGVVEEWDTRASDYNSGFDVLSAALSSEISLTPNRTWPYISGFHPGTAPFGPHMWCEQIVALGSVPIELASDIWRFERDRIEYNHDREPMTYEDLWKAFIQPQALFQARDDWDNLSGGPENAAWNILFDGISSTKHNNQHIHHLQRDAQPKAMKGEDSFEACRESCNSYAACVQFSYTSIPVSNFNENEATRCHLSRSFRLGGRRAPEGSGINDRVTWKSGWRKDRFEKWAQQQRCKSQQN